MSSPNITPTDSQQNALDMLQAFILDKDTRVFILTGYAGTGKTTLMRFLIEHLEEQKQSYTLLSTTGRAAKILANYTEHEANTIHHLIYSYKGLNKDMSETPEEDLLVDKLGQILINFEPQQCPTTDDQSFLYIIDEASMVSDVPVQNPIQAQFGSGRLLSELLNYDTRPTSKFLFIGDPCQLPPISGGISPALNPMYIQSNFNIQTMECSLTQIMRQKGANTLIQAAEQIRYLWQKAPLSKDKYGLNKVWGHLPIAKFPDIQLYSDLQSMVKQYIQIIQEKGYNEATFISYSNREALRVSQQIRQCLGFSGDLQPGDLLLVQQNQLTTGLMNGDMVEVVSVSNHTERTLPIYGPAGDLQSQLRFREITVRELFTQRRYTTLMIDSLLSTGNTNLDARQQSGLFIDFTLRMRAKNITQKKQTRKSFDDALRTDPYLNALRCSYGYAITCHKAQGGEWNKVFIQVQRNITLNPTKSDYQWFYTAITRAKQTACLVNDFFIQ